VYHDEDWPRDPDTGEFITREEADMREELEDLGSELRTVENQRNLYRDALADIEAILCTDNWSVGMLEDIAAIVKRTGVKHNRPPHYYHH